MKRLNKNNKGFTLIELLAVIVILGVLMIIAVPMVSQYIDSAKKGAFVSTAKAYVSAARYAYLNGDYECKNGTNDASIDTGAGGSLYIPFSEIDVDKTGGNSSFNKPIDKDKSYVVIESDPNGRYTYYVLMIDGGSNGWAEAINEEKLKKQNVSNGISGTTLGKYQKIGADDKPASATATIKCTKVS